MTIKKYFVSIARLTSPRISHVEPCYALFKSSVDKASAVWNRQNPNYARTIADDHLSNFDQCGWTNIRRRRSFVFAPVSSPSFPWKVFLRGDGTHSMLNICIVFSKIKILSGCLSVDLKHRTHVQRTPHSRSRGSCHLLVGCPARISRSQTSPKMAIF